MHIREANLKDIEAIQFVRNAVKENVLSSPSVISDELCADYLRNRGKGWVCEIDQTIVGFAIIDMIAESVWALFVHPDHEAKGIGKQLQTTMLDWYFRQGKSKVILGTDPNTRAAKFYKKTGWILIGRLANEELKFEMTRQKWISIC